MRRKIAFITTFIVVIAFIALALLPWWLGAALRVGGFSFGLSFSEYRRLGYTRFLLKSVVVRRPGIEVTAETVEISTPLMWLVRRPGTVTVGRWSVNVTPTDKPEVEAKPEGWRPLRTQLDRIFDGLERWLPPTTVGAGEVMWTGGKLSLSGADWRRDDEPRLTVSALRWDDEIADVVIKRGRGREVLMVDARSADGTWEAVVESEDAEIVGHGRWRGQPLSMRSSFAETGWRPVEANVNAVDWNLPAGYLKLGDFYETVAGHAEITWHNDALTLDVQGEGKPLTGTEAPPLQVQLHGAGGLEELRIDRVEVRLPGIDGHLSEPITIGRDGRLRTTASRFDLAMDLAKQPWFKGRGQVSGVVQITPRDGGVPLVSAMLSTADAAIADWIATRARVEVMLQWPVLRVNTATIQLVDGDELTLGGEWNIGTRTLADGRIQGRVSRQTVGHWLTTDMTFETLEIDAKAAGTWPSVVHEGRAKATGARIKPLRSLLLDTEWKGSGRTLESLAVVASAGETRLTVRGSLGPERALVEEWVLTQKETERLRLATPVRVLWKPTITIGDVRMKGAVSEVSGRLTWGETGEVKMDVTGFDSRWVIELLDVPGPAWTVTSLNLHGTWDRSPANFTAKGEGSVELGGGRRGELVLATRGDRKGVNVETLRASMDRKEVVRANGTLPLTIHPGQSPLLRVDDKAAFAFDATTEPNAFFWEQVTAMTGLLITDPEVRLTMSGTLKKPLGEATIRIGKIAPEASGRLRSWPEIEALDARITGDRTGVALNPLSFRVAGQQVRASGRLPVNQWTELMKDPLGLAKAKGEARIEIPNAEVAALARYAPAYLAPTGTLQVDVALKPGGQLEGVVRLMNAATRPLGPLGTLQSIGAEILLAGRTIELKQVRASAGGQPVILSGKVELPDGKQPRLDLALRGDNLPFVRKAGLLMRGDLDLRIVTNGSDITEITGKTRLRPSFFLMDVRALLPKGGARNAPGRRPPYFAVEIPPFDAWRLDVEVDGDRFLRLRTPIFNGLASSHFRLRGTLGDPRATGEAVIDEGKVLLPFATFTVRQGDVRLTEANPFEPRISLVGTSRRYGYDLRMEVSGTVDKPRVTFSSTPPLESEQVLLMVMAGETPQNEMSYTSRERAARLGAYLGQSLLKQLGGDPESSERFSMTVGERISRQGRETYGVEYELTPRWSLVGEYDEFDEYNLGVKWRVWSERDQEKDGKEDANGKE
jgi:translocation and assembly module TamB